MIAIAIARAAAKPSCLFTSRLFLDDRLNNRRPPFRYTPT